MATERNPQDVQEQAEKPPSKEQGHMFACFQRLYESRDGKLCLFETREGHLVAIDASKLA